MKVREDRFHSVRKTPPHLRSLGWTTNISAIVVALLAWFVGPWYLGVATTVVAVLVALLIGNFLVELDDVRADRDV